MGWEGAGDLQGRGTRVSQAGCGVSVTLPVQAVPGTVTQGTGHAACGGAASPELVLLSALQLFPWPQNTHQLGRPGNPVSPYKVTLQHQLLGLSPVRGS